MTEKRITGRIDAIIANVSFQEMMNRKMKETRMKMNDLKNIETFVESPS